VENFVYILTDGSGNYKIGVSGNIPQRIRQLQPGCPNQIHLFAWSEGNRSPFKLEKDLHRIFDMCRKCGEWFCFSEQDILDIKDSGLFLFPQERLQ
jgi:hypothetical protein